MERPERAHNSRKNEWEQVRMNVKTNDTQARLQALRKLLYREDSSTQEELREELEKLDFEITQSTVSRDLRRIGAIKMNDVSGRTVYRMPTETTPQYSGQLADLVRGIYHNGVMIVIHTDPGSASMLARHIDNLRTDDVLGTIAGDDSIFVAPASVGRISQLITDIENSLAVTAKSGS